jgi:peptide/nickel transport system substrate-binding protein
LFPSCSSYRTRSLSLSIFVTLIRQFKPHLKTEIGVFLDNIFLRVAEAEARMTGLMNGEIQIASTIPPHLISRLESKKGLKASIAPSAEGMFLGMNSKFPPWNNKAARQAVAFAIDRELIAKKVFQGHALVLNGPVGEGQFGYSPTFENKYPYDPQKARKLLEEAGLLGAQVELTTTTNRYLYDVQAAEAMVPMLEAAGFKVKFSTPEYATQFSEIQKGNRAFYYHGRGTMMDPTAALIQMFQTGVTPRIRYSNPEFDRLLEESRNEFDRDKRRAALQKAFAVLQDDVPALFMWRLNIIYGVDEGKVAYRPLPHNRVFGTDMLTK